MLKIIVKILTCININKLECKGYFVAIYFKNIFYCININKLECKVNIVPASHSCKEY